MLNSTKLDATIMIIVDKYFVTTSSYDRITNKAYDPVKNDNIEDIQ